jgi:predicted transcriptional regulator
MSSSPARSSQSSRETPDTDEAGDELSEDDLFEVLSNSRRRYALHALSSNDEEWEIGRLAEQVAAWENETAVEEVTRAERKSVYTALQQLHLPKMDELGFVEYDKDRGTVRPTAAKDDVDIYLDVVRGDDIPWNEYYLGLSAVTAGLVAVAWLDVFPFSEVADIVWAGVVVAVFAFSSLVHYHLQDEMRFGEGSPPTVRD